VAIRVHHLGCGRLAPHGGRLLYGRTSHRHLVCHCLLLETDDRLVLVDSGIGLADIADPTRRLGSMFVRFVRPTLDPTFTAVQQLESLGFASDDISDIVLTHMDLDHAGGLSDFPHARVHVSESELVRAQARPTRHDRMRYRPMQWSHVTEFSSYVADGEPWLGFEAVRDLDGLPPEILMVPLTGHSPGHSGVAIDTGNGWLLHCGDAYFHRGEVDREQPPAPPLLRAFESYAQDDGPTRHRNQQRLRQLFEEHRHDVRLFCAHDPEEYEALRE
jgi:glyoxylase-like metal-dependent hydrolase (beta-lactamase superfamily II)